MKQLDIRGAWASVIQMLSSLIQVFMRIICAIIVTGIVGKTGVFWGKIMVWLGTDIEWYDKGDVNAEEEHYEKV